MRCDEKSVVILRTLKEDSDDKIDDMTGEQVTDSER